MDRPGPPPPPPMPPRSVKQPSELVKMRSDVSPFIQKLRSAPEGYSFEPTVRREHLDPFAPPTGAYFFYGTLSDPSFLSEVLGLSEKPILRPAKLIGYSLKLWGQYPALVDGPTGATVEGMVYEVRSERHGERLADYETKAYTPAPCRIRFTDSKKPDEVSGTTFKYVGNPLDINDGHFDLKVWLRRMGRRERAQTPNVPMRIYLPEDIPTVLTVE